jgi:hypothetical protein
MVKTFFAGNRAHAEAADVFDARRGDQIRDDVESFVEISAIVGRNIWQRCKHFAKIRDFGGEAVEQLLGAEIEIKVSARIEVGGDLLKAVFLGRCDSRSCARGLSLLSRRFVLLAACETRNSANQRQKEEADFFHSFESGFLCGNMATVLDQKVKRKDSAAIRLNSP